MSVSDDEGVQHALVVSECEDYITKLGASCFIYSLDLALQVQDKRELLTVLSASTGRFMELHTDTVETSFPAKSEWLDLIGTFLGVKITFTFPMLGYERLSFGRDIGGGATPSATSVEFCVFRPDGVEGGCGHGRLALMIH